MTSAVIPLRPKPLSEIVGKHVKLRRLGREMAGQSPFAEGPQTGNTFFVNDERGRWFDMMTGRQGGLAEFEAAIAARGDQ